MIVIAALVLSIGPLNPAPNSFEKDTLGATRQALLYPVLIIGVALFLSFLKTLPLQEELLLNRFAFLCLLHVLIYVGFLVLLTMIVTSALIQFTSFLVKYNHFSETSLSSTDLSGSTTGPIVPSAGTRQARVTVPIKSHLSRSPSFKGLFTSLDKTKPIPRRSVGYPISLFHSSSLASRGKFTTPFMHTKDFDLRKYFAQLTEIDTGAPTENRDLLARRHLARRLPPTVEIINQVLDVPKQLQLDSQLLDQLAAIKPYTFSYPPSQQDRIKIRKLFGTQKVKEGFTQSPGAYIIRREGSAYVGGSIHLSLRPFNHAKPSVKGRCGK